MEYDLPAPVCPYANNEQLKPVINEDKELNIMECLSSLHAMVCQNMSENAKVL